MENTSDEPRKVSFHRTKSAEEDQLALSDVDPLDPAGRNKLSNAGKFSDEIFTIEPLEMTIWPNSMSQVIVTFEPKVAIKYHLPVYIQVDDSPTRGKLDIYGEGLAPVARFHPDSIGVGHVNLDSLFEYEVELRNEGEVPVDFCLEERESVLRYKFVPSRGVIPVGQSQKIRAEIVAVNVGNFAESFEFKVKGVLEHHPRIQFSGKVIGPSFVITPRRLDFGGCSYGFLHRQKFEIENKSDIPFDFRIDLIQNGSFDRREFQLCPEVGTIQKYAKMEVWVEFIPTVIKTYELALRFDIDGVGNGLAEIPIVAQCVAPRIAVEPESIDFGNIFIGHQYTKYVTLKNLTEFTAKYDFVKQNPATLQMGEVEVGKESGIVEANSEAKVEVFLTGRHLGHMSFDCYFSVYGSNEPPVQMNVKALCVGPKVDLSATQISFGNVKVLEVAEKRLVLMNNSLIPAVFTALFDPPEPAFKVTPENGEIGPLSCYALDVTAQVTDVMTYASTLKLNFEYLNPFSVPVKVTGTGSPVLASVPMEEIDFGNILTEIPHSKSFTFTNESERTYEIRWSKQKPKLTAETAGEIGFTIDPEYCVINAHESRDFVVTVQSSFVTDFTIQAQCHSTIKRKRTEIYAPIVKGSFIQPLITLSKTSIEFARCCTPRDGCESGTTAPNLDAFGIPKETLTVTNRSKIPLEIEIECPAPFVFSEDSFAIEPKEVKKIDVSFDLSFKKDFCTETISRKAVFYFKNHPQTLSMNLKGILEFPNLEFSNTEPIDFGVSMMNTEQSRSITMMNKFEHTVKFAWELISECESAAKVFDVLPLRGEIEPGKSVEANFNFFAMPDPSEETANYKCLAVCHVLGGPDYQFPLTGYSAAIDYTLEPKIIEFGNRSYTEEMKENMVLRNNSKVPLTFSVRVPKRCSFQSIHVSPRDGTLAPGDRANIHVSVVSGLPKVYHEMIFVRVGGFEELQVPVNVTGQFSQVSLSVPRSMADPAKSVFVTRSQIKLEKLKKASRSQILHFEEEENNEKEQTNEADFGLDDLLEQERLLLVRQLGEKKLTRPIDNSVKFVYLAQYVLDFGEITLGESKRKVIEVKNHVSFPVSFSFNCESLKRTGFQIDPQSLKDVQPDSTIEIEVSFNSLTRKVPENNSVSYDVPITFDDKHKILLTIQAVIKFPEIILSVNHLDFESVVIGQTKSMIVQLQNMNEVNCEFRFGEPVLLNPPTGRELRAAEKERKRMAKGKKESRENERSTPWSIAPEFGILPPSSFINVTIHFSPFDQRLCHMQFPIHVKHSPNPYFLTASGTGVQLQIIFDPPVLTFPPVQPLVEPSESEVTVTNATDNDIEFFSLQFDRDLYNDENADPRQTESPFVTYTPKAKTPVTATKFAVCILVTGAPYSGKTTLSKMLSKEFHLPIINLQEVWQDTTDYTAKLFSVLSEPQYVAGCIIDGVDIHEEGTDKDNDAFLKQCMSIKNLADEFEKTVPPALTHAQPSSYEKALDYVLGALDGHYVFHVSLRMSLEHVIERREKMEQKAINQQKHQAMIEREHLFNMSEEEYMQLDPEAQAEVDLKRSQMRERLLSPPEEEPVTRKRVPKPKKTQQINFFDTTKKGDTSVKPSGRQSVASSRKKKLVLPTDRDQLNGVVYMLAVGSLIQKVQTATDRFKTLDPTNVIEFDLPDIVHSFNTVIVPSDDAPESMLSVSLAFLPPLVTLKRYAFRTQIPQPYTTDDTSLSDTKLMPQPEYFSIVTEDEDRLTPKWRLEPHGSMTLRVKFDSYMPSLEKDELFFAIARSSSPPVSLKVVGSCAYPEIDRKPKAFFTNIAKKFDPKLLPCFLSDTKEFHCGYQLSCKERSAKQPYTYKYPLNLTNVSVFPCEVNLAFQDPSVSAIWGVEQPTVTIPPEKTTTVYVGFNPTKTEVYRGRLVITVKENPEPTFVNFVGECIAPTVDISSLNVDFGKILINTDKVKKVDIKNTGKVPVFWKLKGAEQMGPTVTFSQTQGELAPKGSTSIVMTMQSAKPVAVKKAVQFLVYDITKARQFVNDALNIAGESFDVNLDVILPKTGPQQMDFGHLKVGQAKALQIGLANRGKYPVKYSFTVRDKKLAKVLTISPTEGVSQVGEKNKSVTVTFKAATAVTYRAQKAIRLKVVDTQTNTVTAQQTIAFSAITSYNQFTVSCGKQISFGNVQNGILQKSEFTITNTGHFPFEFEFKPKEEKELSMTGTTSRAKSKLKKPAGKAKGAGVPLGPFNVSPSNGTIQPGAEFTCSVDFVSPLSGSFKEVATILVPDTASGAVGIDLIANSFAPCLVTKGNDKIFPKLPLCFRKDLKRKDITSFLEDERVLHFAPVIVNQKATVDVVLCNAQPIECAVDLNFKPKEGKAKDLPFSCTSKSLVVPPLSKIPVQIVFAPTDSDNFTAQFEATIKSSAPVEPLRFDLEGIGAVPAVTVKTPLEPGKGGYVMNMGRTLVGYDKERSIAIANDGFIAATVTVQIKATPDLEVTGVDTNRQFVLEGGRQFTLTVRHRPQKVRKATADILISIAESGKSSISISCLAESYTEDIVFDGLGDENELRFRDCIVGKVQSTAFTLTNVSDSILRFNWISSNDMTFVPKVGHIRRGQSKEIVASFFSEKPTKYAGAKVVCQLVKIDLVDEEAEDWDDSMKVTAFVPRNEQEVASPRGKNANSGLVQVTTIAKEPAYQVAAGNKPKEVQLKAFAVSDTVKCSLDISEVSFAPTMMYQVRTSDVKLTNSSQIRIEYSWELEKFESVRSSYALSWPCPFSVEPQKGFIEAGQTTTFKANFAPMEADDFTATLKCVVPFRAGEPLLLNCAGLSRRPVCHFNISVSDYLTRRHPDFKYPLPDGVRVVECFSSGVRVKSPTRIEIVNPTGVAYETKWTVLSDNSDNTITCESMNALVSSGKRYIFVFNYTPSTPNLVESLWEFSVPSQNIKVPFLFVGRISH